MRLEKAVSSRNFARYVVGAMRGKWRDGREKESANPNEGMGGDRLVWTAAGNIRYYKPNFRECSEGYFL